MRVTSITLAAALATGVAAYVAAGLVAGYAPALRLRARRRGDGTRHLLAAAGVHVTPAQFWAASACLSGAAFAVLTTATATPAVVVVPAVALGALPRAVLARRRSQRLREIAVAWPDGLRDLVTAVSAGMSLSQALTRLAEAGPEPLQRAFARYPLLARMLGVVPALEAVQAELADPTSDRVIEVLILAHERGGRIVAEVLRDLAEATAEDVRTLDEITTAGLEQKLNARSVFVLPWLVLGTLTARPGHFRDFYQSTGGLVVVALAAALSLVGMIVLTRLGRDPVEERVLGEAAA